MHVCQGMVMSLYYLGKSYDSALIFNNYFMASSMEIFLYQSLE